MLARRGKWDGRSTLDIDGHGAYGVVRSRDHVADLGVGYEVEPAWGLVEGGNVGDVSWTPRDRSALFARVYHQVVLPEGVL